MISTPAKTLRLQQIEAASRALLASIHPKPAARALVEEWPELDTLAIACGYASWTSGKPTQLGEQKCRVCGCTQNHACDGGCWWVEPDLCSSCRPHRERHGAFATDYQPAVGSRWRLWQPLNRGVQVIPAHMTLQVMKLEPDQVWAAPVGDGEAEDEVRDAFSDWEGCIVWDNEGEHSAFWCFNRDCEPISVTIFSCLVDIEVYDHPKVQKLVRDTIAADDRLWDGSDDPPLEDMLHLVLDQTTGNAEDPGWRVASLEVASKEERT